MSFSAKFGTCTVVVLNGTLIVKAKLFTLPLNVRILSSTSVPFRPTKVQMPNLALVETRNGLQYTFIDGGKNEKQKKSGRIKSDFTNRVRKGEEKQ